MRELMEILDFVREIEGLKSVTRTAWTKTGRRESTAEHSWRVSMLLMALEDQFLDIDMNRAIKMSLVHDLGELYEGDISAKLQDHSTDKFNSEEKAMKKVTSFLPQGMGEKIFDLWDEYNKCESREAKLVKALDKLETIIQHNQGDNPVDFDYEFNLEYGKKYFDEDHVLRFLRSVVDEETNNNCQK